MAGVALVTAESARGADVDETPLLDALIWRGVEATVAAWDDRGVDWSAFDLVVVRSAWDHTAREREFGRWLQRVERRSRLANPAAVIEWNRDKRCLRDLAEQGVPVVPTTFLEPGDLVRVPDRGELRVRPVVAASAEEIARYRLPDEAAAMHDRIDMIVRGGGSAMVQPYLTSADEPGEIDLVYIDGQFSHAANRRSGEAHQAGADERAVGDRVMRALDSRGPLLYARVDLLADLRGQPLVADFDLVSPPLYLDLADGAAERFADAIAGWVTRR